MSWKLEGSYRERCSCNVVCPRTAAPALGAMHEGSADFSGRRFSWAA